MNQLRLSITRGHWVIGFQLLISLLVLLIFQGPARASDQSPETIRVAYATDLIPFHYRGPEGSPQGMIIDKWRLWSEKTNIKIEFIPGSWDQTIEFVRTGRADVHAGLFFSKTRNQFLDFGQSLVKATTHIFYTKGLPPHESHEDFSAYKLGVLKGDFAESWLREHLPGPALVRYETYQELMAGLRKKEILVFASDTLTAVHHLKQSGLRRNFLFQSNLPLYTNEFRFAVKKGNTRLLTAISRGMEKITPAESKEITRLWASGSREKDSGALIISIDRQYPPLTLLDQEGSPTGLLVDIWRLWSEATGLKIKFSASSWAESIDAVKNGSADIHSGLFKTGERESWLAFSDPIHSAGTALFFNRGAPLESLKELAGKRLGVMEGTFQADWIKRHHPEIRPLFRKNGEGLILSLLKKEVTAIFHEAMAVEADLNRMGLSGKLKKRPGMILNNAIFAAVPRFNEDLLSLINEGFAAIPREELAQLEQQWLPRKENRFYDSGKGTLALTREEKEFVAGHIPLNFSEVDWQPLSILDGEKGFTGMIADYLDLITKKSGLSFTFIPGKTWEEVLSMYRAGEIDMIPAIGDDDDPGRPILKSRAFVNFPLVIVTGNDVNYIADTAELKGRKVAVGKGYTSHHYLKNTYPEIRLVPTSDVKSGLMAVSSKKADAFVGHMAVVIHTLQSSGFTNLKIAGETGYSFHHRIGLDPRYPQAISIINKVLDNMSPEEHKAIYQKWLSVHYEKGIDTILILKIILAALVIMGIVVYWNRRLAGEVQERKETARKLEESEKKSRAMSEAIHDGLVMINEHARVMYWNPAAEKLFGIPAQEAMDKDIHQMIIPETLRKKAEHGLAEFAKSGKGRVVGRLQELTAQRRDKTRFPAEVGVSAFQVEEKWYAVGTIRDISERKEAEQTLRNIRTELQQILDNAQVGILFLKDGQSIYRCNNRAAEILGYGSPKELVGLDLSCIHMSPQGFETFNSRFRPELETGTLVRTETELRQKKGTGVWCSLSGKAVDASAAPDMEQGVIWVIDDISEKRAARQALKESEKWVSTILNAINTGTLIIDPDTRTIVDANPAAARMIGLPREEILGQRCHNFVCPREEHQCPVLDGRTEIKNEERVLLTAEGRSVPILKTVVQVNLGKKKRLLESFVDLSEQKKAKEELQENLKELEKFYQLTIGREEKMIQLKEEVNHLLNQSGQKEKYKIR